jgi:hypothetical protein
VADYRETHSFITRMSSETSAKGQSEGNDYSTTRDELEEDHSGTEKEPNMGTQMRLDEATSDSPMASPVRELLARGNEEGRTLTTSRIETRNLQVQHARQRLHARQLAKTTHQAGWDGSVYQMTVEEMADAERRRALLVRMAKANAIEKWVRTTREQGQLIRETLLGRLGMEPAHVELWEETTARLAVEMTNVARQHRWNT